MQMMINAAKGKAPSHGAGLHSPQLPSTTSQAEYFYQRKKPSLKKQPAELLSQSDSQISLIKSSPKCLVRNQGSAQDNSPSLLSAGSKPKEIEDLFESTRNFYKNSSNSQAYHIGTFKHQDAQQRGQASQQLNAKDINQSQHSQYSQRYFEKQSKDHLRDQPSLERSANRVQACMMQVNKNQCRDEEALPSNPFLAMKNVKIQSPKKQSSMGSSLSSSPSLTASMKRYIIDKQHFPQSQEESTVKKQKVFSHVGTAPSNQHFVQPPLTDQRQMVQKHDKLHNFKEGSNYVKKSQGRSSMVIQSLDMKAINQQSKGLSQQNSKSDQVLTTLSSYRYQQKLQKQSKLAKQQHAQQKDNPKDNKTIAAFADLTNSLKQATSPKKNPLSRAINELIPQFKTQCSQSINTRIKAVPTTKICLHNSIRPSILGTSQAKRLTDDSEGELINSKDMASSFSKSPVKDQDEKENSSDASFKMPSDVRMPKQFGEPPRFYSSSAGLDSQKSHDSQMMHLRELEDAEAQPTWQRQSRFTESVACLKSGQSSSRRRAQWDRSNGRLSAFNDSSSKHVDQDFLSAQGLKQSTEFKESQNKIQELHLQYLAVKKELQDLKKKPKQPCKKAKRTAYHSPHSQERKFESIMSADEEDNPSQCCSNNHKSIKAHQKSTLPGCQISQNKDSIKRMIKNKNHFLSQDSQFPVNGDNVFASVNKKKKCLRQQKGKNQPDSMKSQLQLGLRKLSMSKLLREGAKPYRKAQIYKRRQKDPNESVESQVTSKISYSYQPCKSHNAKHSLSRSDISQDKVEQYKDNFCSCFQDEEKTQRDRSQTRHERSVKDQNILRSKAGKSTTKKKSRRDKSPRSRKDNEIHYQKRQTMDCKQSKTNQGCSGRKSNVQVRGPTSGCGSPQMLIHPSQWVSPQMQPQRMNPFQGQMDQYAYNLQYWNAMNPQAQGMYPPQFQYPHVVPTQNLPLPYSQGYQLFPANHAAPFQMAQSGLPSTIASSANPTMPLSSNSDPSLYNRPNGQVPSSWTPNSGQNENPPPKEASAFEEYLQFAKTKTGNGCNVPSKKLAEYSNMLNQIKYKDTHQFSRNDIKANRLVSGGSHGDNRQNIIFRSQNPQSSAQSDSKPQAQPNQLQSKRFSQIYDQYDKIQFKYRGSEQPYGNQVETELQVEHPASGRRQSNIFNQSISSIGGAVVENCLNESEGDFQKRLSTRLEPQSRQQATAEFSKLKTSTFQNQRDQAPLQHTREPLVAQINLRQQPAKQASLNKEAAKEVLWIDFSDTSVAKGKHQNEKGGQSSSRKGKDSAVKNVKDYPQSIPEDKEDEICSPNRSALVVKKGLNEQNSLASKSLVKNECQTHKDKKENPPTSNPKEQPQSWAMDFSVQKEVTPKSPNLANAFKEKVLNLEQRLSHKQGTSKSQSAKKGPSKEELFQKRREILRSARQNISQARGSTSHQKGENQSNDNTPQCPGSNSTMTFDTSKNKQNNTETKAPSLLLNRLAAGEKREICRKEMLRLTSKNYNQLPEIKQKKLDEAKKEETKRRLTLAKEQEKLRRKSQLYRRHTQTQKMQSPSKDWSK